MSKMTEDNQKEKFRKWLDILQQESWQLELIISGFAIYGLFLIVDPIKIAVIETQQDENMYAGVMYSGLLISWFILAVNLLAHVVLRGLWIGAIGLRYVSGDIDYDALKYSPKFMNHLKTRVGSFDEYVEKLEKYCSIIFAVTFLLVFYLLGLLIIIFLLNAIGSWIDGGDDESYRVWIGSPFLVFIIVGSIVTFIDFITQGWLKRKKWTTFFYYPIYWVFKYLTLSFLYRPMVYNFLDTKFGKRLSFIIVPLYVCIAVLAGFEFNTSNYILENSRSSSIVASVENYNELLVDDTDFVNLASIPNKVITDPFLQVFIVYGSTVEDDVFYFNKELEPENDNRGLQSPVQFSGGNWKNSNKNLEDYVAALESMYTINVDSLCFDPNFVLTKNSRSQKGYETFLDLKDLNRGKHLLEISRKDHFKDSVYVRSIIKIPFWYYPK